MFTVLSWNILQGGGSRLKFIINALSEISATVLILSEFRNGDTGRNLIAELKKLGYSYIVSPSENDSENKVLVASKLAGEPVIFNNSENILGIRFSLFTVLGVYMPHKKKHSIFEIIAEFKTNNNTELIVAGDYNTGHNFIDQAGDSFWYQNELKAFETSGMIDAYRFLHADTKEFSWFSHGGNGFRYDHTYVSEGLTAILKSSTYLHEYRENKISDHSPMLIRIG